MFLVSKLAKSWSDKKKLDLLPIFETFNMRKMVKAQSNNLNHFQYLSSKQHDAIILSKQQNGLLITR